MLGVEDHRSHIEAKRCSPGQRAVRCDAKGEKFAPRFCVSSGNTDAGECMEPSRYTSDGVNVSVPRQRRECAVKLEWTGWLALFLHVDVQNER